MAQHSLRYAAGSTKGGQYRPKPHADELSTNDLRIENWNYPTTAKQGTTLVEMASNLERRLSVDDHRAVAINQSAVADTAAELWHSHCRSPEHVLSYLRGHDTRENITPFDVDMAKSLQKSILSADLKEPHVVYRGLCSNLQSSTEDLTGREIHHVVDLILTVEPGEMLMSEGFWSTSTDPSVAVSFTNPVVSDRPTSAVLLRIETTVGKFLPSSSSPESYHFHPEREVVLPHGAMFEVVAKEEIINDMDIDKRPITLFTLKYVDVDAREAALDHLAPLELSDEEDRRVRDDVQYWINTYEQNDLPMGACTSDPRLQDGHLVSGT